MANLRQSRHVFIKNCVLDADSRIIYTHIDLDDGEFTAKQACMYKKNCVLDADSRVIYTHIDLDDGEFTAKQACMYKKLCVRCRPSCYLHTHRSGWWRIYGKASMYL